MGTIDTSVVRSYYVYRHQLTSDQMIYSSTPPLKNKPGETFDINEPDWEKCSFMSLDQAIALARACKDCYPGWIICVGGAITKVDPFFDILVVQ